MPSSYTSTHYWLDFSTIKSNGDIVMRSTGVENGGLWTGLFTCHAQSADYQFWLWILNQKHRWKDWYGGKSWIDENRLTELRKEYESSLA